MAADIAERDEPQRKKSNPVKFYREVLAEGRKVHWATRQETLVSTLMVVIMVTMASIFFFATDLVMHFIVNIVLGR